MHEDSRAAGELTRPLRRRARRHSTRANLYSRRDVGVQTQNEGTHELVSSLVTRLARDGTRLGSPRAFRQSVCLTCDYVGHERARHSRSSGEFTPGNGGPGRGD